MGWELRDGELAPADDNMMIQQREVNYHRRIGIDIYVVSSLTFVVIVAEAGNCKRVRLYLLCATRCAHLGRFFSRAKPLPLCLSKELSLVMASKIIGLS